MTLPLALATLSQLDRTGFDAAVGAVFEHSPWVMARVWERRPFADRAALRAAMQATLASAGRDEVLALILAHPELASKAALRGELTEDSAREQAGAGLSACSPEELAEIRRLNDAYREKFGWPFIVAVRGLTRQDIIAAMRQRLPRSADEEFAEAQAQILRIADLRLDALLA
ncbi:2-oxo-4-hydroxy-4-carboxy-5-ureidoimidazoline decarboxylase [Azonexus caeni]|jgi:2-oxo-4-hydroxy-4-carboxy-5-ureidoimidazoline decarboxylase|uniref:2-oxo-4-hydroxy-4-carboxy-5-ureidoimidazoline decarboxylase n=1 Tax=Azonexus caeni TaxID=266126 RepID=UPI003A85267C